MPSCHHVELENGSALKIDLKDGEKMSSWYCLRHESSQQTPFACLSQFELGVSISTKKILMDLLQHHG